MSVEDYIIVKTPLGYLRGRKLPSARRDYYYSFQGIPYAKPPLGDLRFKPPVPVESWAGVQDALVEGCVAPSFNELTEKMSENSSEDCLFLNVYTPKIPKNQPESLMPVMFWIHGGGFNMGSGNTDFFGPDYLVVENVVIVTCNYRLGALGFLSLQTPECPGNYGLKDLIMALKWCQENISSFGGDPRNVTLFGESAGGAAVHYLTLSKATEGLFHKAIAQSGVVLNPWAFARHPRKCAFKLGEAFGCKAEDDEELLKFLRTIKPEDLIIKGKDLLKVIEPNEHFLLSSFLPCVEPKMEGAVITSEPGEKLCKNGRRIPFMLGANTLEGLIFKRGLSTKFNFETDLHKLVPNFLKVKRETAEGKKIIDEIRNFYFPNGFDKNNLTNILSQIYFLNGINETIEFYRKFSGPFESLFVYLFSYDGQVFCIKDLIGCRKWKGACHGDELAYLFKPNILDSKILPGTKDYATMETLTKIWTDFAKFGNPMPEKSWSPISHNNFSYMEINEVLTQRSDFFKSDFEFWKSVQDIASKKV